MRITYDPRADALAIELRDVPVARTHEVTDTINVDLGKDGRAVVVEILNVRKGLGDEVLQQVGLDLGGVQWQPEQDTVMLRTKLLGLWGSRVSIFRRWPAKARSLRADLVGTGCSTVVALWNFSVPRA